MSSPTDEQLGAAFRDLVAQQPFTPDVSAIEQRARRSRRRDLITRGGIGAGLVAAAAVAVGVASAVPSAPARPAQAGGGSRPVTRASAPHPAVRASVAHPAKAGRSSASADGAQTLVQLAAVLDAKSSPSGDATLIERETAYPGQASINVWDLYADNGEYFFSQTRAGLPAQVSENNNQGQGVFAREIAAATYAATGNLDTAALKMAWAADTTPPPAWIRAQVKDISAGGLQIDNYVWENSEDSLVAGAGNPQVRAGVLRLVSILPDITVTHGTVDGQPTLTITAGAGEVGTVGTGSANPKAGGGAPYQEAITVNADTGIPLQIVGGTAGSADVTVSYVVTRVSLADVAAGKF